MPPFMDLSNFTLGRKKFFLQKYLLHKYFKKRRELLFQKDSTRNDQARQGSYGQVPSLGQTLTTVFRVSAKAGIFKPYSVDLNQESPFIFLQNLQSDHTNNMHSD